MAFVRPKARILERTATAGNGPYTVSGAVDLSYNAFSSFMSVGDTTYASVVEPNVAMWTGIVTYSAANQITLTTVEESKGTFGSGTKEIFAGPLAARQAYLDIPTSFTDTTDATDSTHGAFTIAGGLAVAKKLFVGLTATIGGVFKVTDATEATGAGTTASGIFSGGLEILKKLYVTGNAIFRANLLTAASTTGTAGLTVPTGTAPTSPADGDIWNDGTNVKIRVGSTTKILTPILPTVSIVTASSHSGGFSANSTGTYTSPANCTWTRVRAVGGGGGGSGGFVSTTAGPGGNTTFSTLTAGGAAGGVGGGTSGAGGAGGPASGGDINVAGSGGSPANNSNAAGSGGASYFGGGGMGSAPGSRDGAAGALNSGSGGGGGGGGSSSQVGGGGGAGGYTEKIFGPLNSVSFAVGAAGTGTAGGGSGAGAGGNGGSGIIIVEEFYN